MKNTQADKYGAAEKCRAVLAVWTERKKCTALCREMGVSDSLFGHWQDRALLGMLEALEPRGTREAEQGPALPEQIRRLLDRKVRARELQSLGRSANWRGRLPKSRAPAPTPPSAAVP